MTKNLKDKLHRLESQHVKAGKLCANIILELEDKKRSKNYFNVVERRYENQLSELYTDNKKTKSSTNSNDF